MRASLPSTALLFVATLAVTGCGLSIAPSANTGSPVQGAAKTTGFSGKAIGGQQPITGATVTLWAAGAPTTGGGYGTGATSIATTTTDANGSFTFDTVTDAISAYSITSNVATFTATNAFTAGQSVTLSGFPTSTFFNGQVVTVLSTGLSGTQFEANFTNPDSSATEAGSATIATTASPCTTGQLLYITSQSGNPGSSGNNSAAALLAALPSACSSSTGQQSLIINEVSTIASVWALQQFMSITPGGSTPWQIGAPSTNLAGLTNAFAQITQLENPVYGQSAVFSTKNTIGTTTYTTAITPDSARIYMLANILAYCVNSVDSTPGTVSTNCANLLTDTQPGGSTKATDTIQMAYYLATNPAGLTMPNGGATQGSPYHLCSTYVTPFSPYVFSPALSCTSTVYPTDWTIWVSWKTTIPGPTTVGTVDAGSVAIDSNSNIWTGGATGLATNFVNQFNQAGQIVMAPVNTATTSSTGYTLASDNGGTTTSTGSVPANTAYTLTYAKPGGLAIDTNNAAWYSSYATASPGTVSGIYTGVLAQVSGTGATPTSTAYYSGFNPGALAIDGANNVYTIGNPNGSGTIRYYMSELLSSAAYQTFNWGIGRLSSTNFNQIGIDQTASNNVAWGFQTSATCTNFAVYRAASALEASSVNGADTGQTYTLPSACSNQGAIDAANNAWVVGGGNLSYVNITSATSPTPTAVTTLTGSTQTSTTGTPGTGGLNTPSGVAIDGLGNVWALNRVNNTVGGLTELTGVSTTGTTTSYTVVSPSAAGVFGFQTYSALAPTNVQIDSSGNLWLSTTGGSLLYHMVGGAGPVVTPISLAIKTGKLGVRP